MPTIDDRQPLDVQLLECFVADDADRTRLGHAVCAALEIDVEAAFASCFEIFSRRDAMARERWPQIAEAIAIFDTFVAGIGYGYQLALARDGATT